MTIVEPLAPTRPITGGVDTHLDVHVAAALDPIGGLVGVKSFPTDARGCRQVIAGLVSFGPLAKVAWKAPGPTASDWPIVYTERLAEEGALTSVGSRGDSYDNALAETVIGRAQRRVQTST